MTDVLVIAGPAGVGKSSVAFEVSLELQAAGVAHALIDSDELDRVFPIPTDLPRITERNLAAVWETFRDRGISRLILAGVVLDQPAERAWILRAIPGARFTFVRLTAAAQTVLDRVRHREIGSGLQSQLVRTEGQLTAAIDTPSDVHIVTTDGRHVAAIAKDVRIIWTTSH